MKGLINNFVKLKRLIVKFLITILTTEDRIIKVSQGTLSFCRESFSLEKISAVIVISLCCWYMFPVNQESAITEPAV